MGCLTLDAFPERARTCHHNARVRGNKCAHTWPYFFVLCARVHKHHARTQPSANHRLKPLEDIPRISGFFLGKFIF